LARRYLRDARNMFIVLLLPTYMRAVSGADDGPLLPVYSASPSPFVACLLFCHDSRRFTPRRPPMPAGCRLRAMHMLICARYALVRCRCLMFATCRSATPRPLPPPLLRHGTLIAPPFTRYTPLIFADDMLAASLPP